MLEFSRQDSAMTRPTKSLELPAPNGTIMEMGRDGYV
jgi:hypothetical protein